MEIGIVEHICPSTSARLPRGLTGSVSTSPSLKTPTSTPHGHGPDKHPHRLKHGKSQAVVAAGLYHLC